MSPSSKPKTSQLFHRHWAPSRWLLCRHEFSVVLYRGNAILVFIVQALAEQGLIIGLIIKAISSPQHRLFLLSSTLNITEIYNFHPYLCCSSYRIPHCAFLTIYLSNGLIAIFSVWFSKCPLSLNKLNPLMQIICMPNARLMPIDGSIYMCVIGDKGQRSSPQIL